MNHTCGECFFFGVHTKHRHAGTRGECRRFPPLTKTVKDRGSEVDVTFYPPRIQADDSCGEFRATPIELETRDNIIKQETTTCLSEYIVNKIKRNQS